MLDKDKYETFFDEFGEVCIRRTQTWKSKQLESRLEYDLKLTGLPLHAFNLKLSNYIGEDRTIPRKLSIYLDNYESKYKHVHLYFWSRENGTQKTTTASILGTKLVRLGYTVRFILMGDLLKLLTNAEFDEETKAKVQSLKTCDWLCIDDAFDKTKCVVFKSGYQISFLDTFLRERLEVLRKSTCFTSNFSLDEINEDVFGKSLKKLMKRSIIDPFKFTTSYEERNAFNPEDLWN